LFKKIQEWNTKYDIWSFISDFFFLFGVVFLNWSPILLLLWFMLDTIVMMFFTYLLFHKENKGWIKTVGFAMIPVVVIITFGGLYDSLMKHIEDIEMDHLINADPFQIINFVVLPIALSASALNHASAYQISVQKMQQGTYTSSFIKHFF